MSKMRQKIKREDMDTASGSKAPVDINDVERDLTYYIEDRVELMKQVFSILKPKELQAMASECCIGLDLDELQELCLEEVLGISSKRLCAILDGAEPPSDTESSSDESKKRSEQLDIISLDSISSDDISTHSHKQNKKKKKHTKCHRKRELELQSQPQKHDRKKKSQSKKEDMDTSTKDDAFAAKKAGMTILELLELQARARAIRAQLALENNLKDDGGADGSKNKNLSSSSDSEVQIKEEPQEVVEIESSEEDVKNVLPEQKKKNKDKKSKRSKTYIEPVAPALEPERDLTVIVPQRQQTQKVKLKRTRTAQPVLQVGVENLKLEDSNESDSAKPQQKTLEKSNKSDAEKDNSQIDNTYKKDSVEKSDNLEDKNTKRKYRTHKKKLRKNSDHDELELELSDTEKMDLLENFHPENYDDVTTSGSDSSDSDEGSDLRDVIERAKAKKNIEAAGDVPAIILSEAKETEKCTNEMEKSSENTDIMKPNVSVNEEIEVEDNADAKNDKISKDLKGNDDLEKEQNVTKECEVLYKKQSVLDKEQPITGDEQGVLDTERSSSDKKQCSTEEQPVLNENANIAEHQQSISEREQRLNEREQRVTEREQSVSNKEHCVSTNESKILSDFSTNQNQGFSKARTSSSTGENEITNKSDGELTDRSSSDVEMYDKPPEVIAISDDELAKAANIMDKEKLKKRSKKSKEKKHKKKSKKSKKSDFHEGADQNFFDKSQSHSEENNTKNSLRSAHAATEIITIDIDNSSENTDRNKFFDKNQKNLNLNSLRTTHLNDIITVQIENDYLKSSVSNIISPIDVIEQFDNIPIEDSENSDDIYCVSDSDEFNQIFEISDDSELSESEEYSVLSKEPTSDEIEAFSLKIEYEIECEKREIASNLVEKSMKDDINEDIDNVSWKDRWLESKSVKKVLATSNILNAIRKKNIELKKKLAESKIILRVNEENAENATKISEGEKLESQTKIPTKESFEIERNIEGSIGQYNMLQGSTKYVDPVQEPEIENINVNIAMKKDAKQLMKMYKRLLKVSKNKDKRREKNKEKKKEKKKSKNKKDGDVLTAVNVENGNVDDQVVGCRDENSLAVTEKININKNNIIEKSQ